MEKSSKIYVAGHRGLVGLAILRKLHGLGYKNLVCRSHLDLDLTKQERVDIFFDQVSPVYVFLAAVKLGGILANNTYPADFIYSNLAVCTREKQCIKMPNAFIQKYTQIAIFCPSQAKWEGATKFLNLNNFKESVKTGRERNLIHGIY